MFTLKAENSFDAAHFLAGYKGKCGNIHGHRWKVEIEIFSDNLSTATQTRGMIVDFDSLKEDLKTVVDYFDHTLIVEKDTLRDKTMEALLEEGILIREVEFRSTAENFSKYFYDVMTRKGYNVKCATVYETPTNCASYYE